MISSISLSTVFPNADDFDPSNPDTFNSSTSVTIFDNLGNPVIATAFFIKTQAASGDNATHKYQTKFIVDGREVQPSLTEAISPAGQTLVVDRFGQIIPINEKPQIVSVAQTQPLFYLDDLANKTVSKAATVTNEVLEDAAFTKYDRISMEFCDWVPPSMPPHRDKYMVKLVFVETMTLS